MRKKVKVGTRTSGTRLRGRLRKKSKRHSNVQDSIGWGKRHTLSEANLQGKLEDVRKLPGERTVGEPREVG